MIFEDQTVLTDRIRAVSRRRINGPVDVIEDTSNYMAIMSGDVLRVAGNDYFIMADATEGRFGISEQPKFWVKYAIDLSDGTRKILKLVFLEEFKTRLGFVTIHCSRDPDKESRVLDIVRGNPRFMQGRTVRDNAGNNIRVIDHIRGKSLYNFLADLEMPHEQYYHDVMPGVLREVAACIDAVQELTDRGTMHGDVRNDHILVDSDSGTYRWIDFDFNVNFKDYDIWSMGNILTYVVGKGLCTRQDAEKQGRLGPNVLQPEDSLLFFRYRIANIRKLYPYVSRKLNEILMRFSAGTADFYSDCRELARDVTSWLE